jgi:hypothetical protein
VIDVPFHCYQARQHGWWLYFPVDARVAQYVLGLRRPGWCRRVGRTGRGFRTQLDADAVDRLERLAERADEMEGRTWAVPTLERIWRETIESLTSRGMRFPSLDQIAVLQRDEMVQAATRSMMHDVDAVERELDGMFSGGADLDEARFPSERPPNHGVAGAGLGGRRAPRAPRPRAADDPPEAIRRPPDAPDDWEPSEA